MQKNEVLTGRYSGCKIVKLNTQICITTKHHKQLELEERKLEQKKTLKNMVQGTSLKELLKKDSEYSKKSALLAATEKELLGFKGVPMYININAETVESIENADKDIRTSGTSGIIRGAVGSAILGPVGLLAAVGAKKKNIYTIVVSWKDGSKSVLALDAKNYQTLLLIV